MSLALPLLVLCQKAECQLSVTACACLQGVLQAQGQPFLPAHSVCSVHRHESNTLCPAGVHALQLHRVLHCGLSPQCSLFLHILPDLLLSHDGHGRNHEAERFCKPIHGGCQCSRCVRL